MGVKECDYKEFFSILSSAIKNGDSVKRSDDHKELKCGFIVNGQERYLAKMKELKYAKMNGIDLSQYMDLEE